MANYTPPTASGNILTFNESSYTPPTASGNSIIIGGAVGNTLQIWSDTLFVYTATSVGLDIYEIASENKYAYIEYVGGFTTVWGNDERIFMGTTNSGVKYLNKTCISGSISLPILLNTCLNDFSFGPRSLTSNNVKYIHGSGRTVMVLTESGVDVVKYGFQGYHSFTTVTGGTKCFMTSGNTCYYILNQGGTWSLNRVNTCLGDWALPNHSYVTGSGVFPVGLTLNDIFVTEYTSSINGSNTIFTATSSGVYVIDEGQEIYKIYYAEK